MQLDSVPGRADLPVVTIEEHDARHANPSDPFPHELKEPQSGSLHLHPIRGANRADGAWKFGHHRCAGPPSNHSVDVAISFVLEPEHLDIDRDDVALDFSSPPISRPPRPSEFDELLDCRVLWRGKRGTIEEILHSRPFVTAPCERSCDQED
jgi:hypothetical protein